MGSNTLLQIQSYFTGKGNLQETRLWLNVEGLNSRHVTRCWGSFMATSVEFVNERHLRSHCLIARIVIKVFISKVCVNVISMPQQAAQLSQQSSHLFVFNSIHHGSQNIKKNCSRQNIAITSSLSPNTSVLFSHCTILARIA